MARIGRSNNRIDRTVLLVCAVLSLIALVLPTQVREPIASGLRRSILAPLLRLQQSAEESRRALTMHDAVVSQRDSIALREMGVESLETENVRLREILGLGSRLKWGFVPAEALHGRGVRDEFGVTLSAGSRAGVLKLSPVVAPEGLVGVVDNVDPMISHAMVWTHPDFRVSAMAEDASAFGIVQAHLESGAGRYLMEMRGVPFRTSIKPGTMVVSSGLGGVYPRGIPIGRVIGETKTAETWARTYLIRPAVFPADVYAVMILRPDRATAGVDNVWAVGTIADSSVRKVVAAGDSLARTAALAEASARQAVQDSITRDSLRRAGVPEQSIVPPADSLARAKRPIIRRDSVRVDTTRRDTLRRAPVRRDTVPGPHTP
ncbi:MAG TPA: rod shape-determining protein MreC [Gemmatimonadaceae bacterium]|nr:rod shape-determining protein MreC [Gemmatimonadaceae bacterium]